ncbi:hypothetical protein [Saccharothrix sp. HUAS TT10]
MRQDAAVTALTAAVTKHFPQDVADAITADEDFFAAVARYAVRDLDADTPEDFDRLVAAVAKDTEDHTLDWLADTAESPTGWLKSRL